MRWWWAMKQLKHFPLLAGKITALQRDFLKKGTGTLITVESYPFPIQRHYYTTSLQVPGLKICRLFNVPFPCTTWNKAFLKGPGQRWLAIYLLNIYIYIYLYEIHVFGVYCGLHHWNLIHLLSTWRWLCWSFYVKCCRYLQYLQHSYQGVFTCLVQQTNPRQTPAWQFCKRALFLGWLSDLQLGNRKVTNRITWWISVNLNGSEIRKNMQECLHQFFITKFTLLLFVIVLFAVSKPQKKHKKPMFFIDRNSRCEKKLPPR